MKSKDKVLAKELRDLKNVGKATLADLHLLGIYSVKELSSQDATELFHKIENESGQRQDPFVGDVFAAIIHEAKTGEANSMVGADSSKERFTKSWQT